MLRNQTAQETTPGSEPFFEQLIAQAGHGHAASVAMAVAPVRVMLMRSYVQKKGSDPEFGRHTGESAFSKVNTAWTSPATMPRAFLIGGAR